MTKIKHAISRFAVVVVTGVSVAGCSSLTGLFKGEPKDPDLQLRAAFVDKSECPNSDPGNSQANAVPAFAAGLAIQAIDKVVSFANGKLQDAAEADRTAFTLNYKTPAYLYSSDLGKQKSRCLIVAVAAPDRDQQLCKVTTLANGDTKTDVPDWFDPLKLKCDAPAKIAGLLNQWGFAEPKLYAEIDFTGVEGGSGAYQRPILRKLYYPEGLSRENSKDIKGLVFEISATDASANNTPTVFSVKLNGAGLHPNADQTKNDNLELSDTWLHLTPDGAAKTEQKLAKPVNLTVTLAETPRPHWLLQQAAKLAEKKKDDAADYLKDALIPSVHAENELADAVKKRDAEKTAIEKCDAKLALDQKIANLNEQRSKLTTDVEKQRKDNEIRLAKLQLEAAIIDQDAAWTAAGKSGTSCVFPAS